jgi:hypothetical protein
MMNSVHAPGRGALGVHEKPAPPPCCRVMRLSSRVFELRGQAWLAGPRYYDREALGGAITFR